MGEWDWLRLTYLLAVLALVGPSAYALQRGRGTALTHAAIWLALALAAALLYRVFGFD